MFSSVKTNIDATELDKSLINPLMHYTFKKAHKQYPLHVRVDEYENKSDQNAPSKFVTKFVLDTKKGKVVAPTIGHLMDALDQQQLAYDKTDKGPDLKVKKAIYANAKIHELEKLEDMVVKGDTLSPNAEQKLKKLQNMLTTATSVKPPTMTNALAQASATAQLVKGIDAAHPPPSSGQSTPTPGPPTPPPGPPKPLTVEEKTAAELAKSAELDKQLDALKAKTAAGLVTNIKGKTDNLPAGNIGNPPSGETLAERIARLTQKTNLRNFRTIQGELPEGWKEADDPTSGKKYYYKGTKIQWNKPTEGGKYRMRTRKNKNRKNKSRRNRH